MEYSTDYERCESLALLDELPEAATTDVDHEVFTQAAGPSTSSLKQSQLAPTKRKTLGFTSGSANQTGDPSAKLSVQKRRRAAVLGKRSRQQPMDEARQTLEMILMKDLPAMVKKTADKDLMHWPHFLEFNTAVFTDVGMPYDMFPITSLILLHFLIVLADGWANRSKRTWSMFLDLLFRFDEYAHVDETKEKDGAALTEVSMNMNGFLKKF